ncbi:MAG TPA: HAD-IIIA family hydrolase, partial [Steroidobacteraceae bacterium]|nr:HAD-IIIA family hydrolase [Steroidobacteraceae bacterium]
QGLEFLPGAIEGLRRLHSAGYRLIIISNQSGVARGLLTLERLEQINQHLRSMVREGGALLTGIYCCPHHPSEGCACRKPNVELVRQAAHELKFNPAAAVVIGDRNSDIELGRRLGATTIRIAPTPDAELRAATADLDTVTLDMADYRAKDLLEAAQIIEGLPPPDALARDSKPLG